jgi:hypothetical protein
VNRQRGLVFVYVFSIARAAISIHRIAILSFVSLHTNALLLHEFHFDLRPKKGPISEDPAKTKIGNGGLRMRT